MTWTIINIKIERSILVNEPSTATFAVPPVQSAAVLITISNHGIRCN
jgi:hypothetical protein